MAHLVRSIGIVACALVFFGFVGFAADEMRYGSETQQAKLANELNEPDLGPNTERKREREHSGARELIDDSNDILLAPFAGVTHSTNPWASRGIPTVLALLAYGLLLVLIANSLPKPKAQSGGDWRTAS
jgi:hypothetical protein